MQSTSRWPPKTNPRHTHIRFQTLFHSPPSQTSHPQQAELIKISSCQSVSLCQHSVFFCEESERQEAEICSLAQGRLLWREARGPEGTYSILHKWHHTVTALRHPPELIQQRITTVSNPPDSFIILPRAYGAVSTRAMQRCVSIRAGGVICKTSGSQAKSPINVSKHSLCQHH